MQEVIKAHIEKYPEMKPADVIKLLYQGELGVGHMISSADMFYKRLLAEFEATQRATSDCFTEDIGGGYVRVYLDRLDTDILPIERLSELCLLSASMADGSIDALKAKINRLISNFNDFSFNFTLADLEEYIARYAEAGYPPVSHSEEYRTLYKPAYRVVRKSLIELYFEEKKGTNI